MIFQLDPPISVRTPLGDGVAILILDYGVHCNSIWAVAVKEIDWTVKHFDSNDIKISRNWTLHFGSLNKIENDSAKT